MLNYKALFVGKPKSQSRQKTDLFLQKQIKKSINKDDPINQHAVKNAASDFNGSLL